MQDFHHYYSGQRKAPYLTIFVGGNHEASNHLFELYYGGWAAPNIYYMGAANVLRVGPLRIAGMSGIWKGYDYRKPHHERLPYSQDDVKSVYHTREVDVRKLLNLRTQVDIGVSHDWPRGVEWNGNHRKLFSQKSFFEKDAKDGTLGSQAAKLVMDRLRPLYWFSAHLHVKFSAVVHHKNQADTTNGASAPTAVEQPSKNTDEIDLDMDDEDDDAMENAQAANGDQAAPSQNGHPVNEVSDDLKAQLPAAFTAEKTPPPERLPFPKDIANKTTRFLALDKCLPNRHFLQLVSIPTHTGAKDEIQRPVMLEYDKEWLAICRVFGPSLKVGDDTATSKDLGEAHYRPLIETEEKWVQENLVDRNKMTVPENFQITAPVYVEERGIRNVQMPREYTNNQTSAFCELLQIPNPFDISEEERDGRMAAGPRQSDRPNDRDGGRGFGGGGGRGRGGFRGRGRDRGHRGGRW